MSLFEEGWIPTIPLVPTNLVLVTDMERLFTRQQGFTLRLGSIAPTAASCLQVPVISMQGVGRTLGFTPHQPIPFG